MIEIRPIVDAHGNEIGTVSLPANSSEEAWDHVMAQFNTTPTQISMNELVKSRIRAARGFGQDLIYQYGTYNVLSGFTVEQIQSIMSRTLKLVAALTTGSLYVAIEELNALELDDTIITETVVTQYRNKIEDFLGIPRT